MVQTNPHPPIGSSPNEFNLRQVHQFAIGSNSTKNASSHQPFFEKKPTNDVKKKKSGNVLRQSRNQSGKFKVQQKNGKAAIGTIVTSTFSNRNGDYPVFNKSLETLAQTNMSDGFR
mmetsp:Transcript_4608/g.4328  ORF Transcript_4608/g.4328 Transcript_4608/m.4328 type:complete len:116 (+) Transcript_4608:86-433(+)